MRRMPGFYNLEPQNTANLEKARPNLKQVDYEVKGRSRQSAAQSFATKNSQALQSLQLWKHTGLETGTMRQRGGGGR